MACNAVALDVATAAGTGFIYPGRAHEMHRPEAADVDASVMKDSHDYLSSLPEAVLAQVFMAVDSVSALLSLSASCRQMRHMMTEPFWEKVFNKHCPGVKIAPWFRLDFRSLVAMHHKQICGECQRFSPAWVRFPWYDSANKRLCRHCAPDYGYTYEQAVNLQKEQEHEQEETSMLALTEESKKRKRIDLYNARW